MTPEAKWITAEGWSTVHLQRAESHPIDSPLARWTLCGRLVRAPLPALWDDEGRCGQCLRRRVDLAPGVGVSSSKEQKP